MPVKGHLFNDLVLFHGVRTLSGWQMVAWASSRMGIQVPAKGKLKVRHILRKVIQKIEGWPLIGDIERRVDRARSRTILLDTHGRGIVAIFFEISSEALIFIGDGVLVNVGQEEEGQKGTEDAKGARDEERVLAFLDLSMGILDRDWQHIGAHKSSNLSRCRGIGVVLATNSGSTGLRGTQTDIVTWAELAEGKEDTVLVSI